MMKPIHTGPVRDTTVRVPGSKSYTHRTLICAALSGGECRVDNWLDSEDTRHTLEALVNFGARVEFRRDGIYILGSGGVLAGCDSPIYLGNSGTSMRLLAAVAALGRGPYLLCGADRMHERPIQHLLDALTQLGIFAVSKSGNGCPPVEIRGGEVTGRVVSIDCSLSSQFLSGLLLMAPYTKNGLRIEVTKGPVSRPYIDMTIDIMERFGVRVQRNGYAQFEAAGGQMYQPGDYSVEPDASQAGYFWAAGAVTGAAIKVAGITRASAQGDVRFAEVLARMGCEVLHEPDGITVKGGSLVGVTVDMADMPDIVPTLAVAAAFAKGVTRIQNVAHLKVKESDRLTAVITELTKMGISARAEDDDLLITGGAPKGAVIETYNDHRMAMSFSVAGLSTPGVIIQNAGCVAKSFPGFWEVFEGLNGE